MKLKGLFLLLFIALSLVGCIEREVKQRPKNNYNLQIYNRLNKTKSIKFDDKDLLLKDSINKRYYQPGEHKLKLDSSDIALYIFRNRKALINLNKDSIIMEELLYENNLGFSDKAKPSDYSTEFKLLNLNGEKYYGPYKIFKNTPIINDWHFGLYESPLSVIKSESDLYRTSFSKISYYKIYTVEEFKKTKKSFNNSNEWVTKILMDNVSFLESGFKLTVEQANFLVVEFPDDKNAKISVASAFSNNKDELLLKKIQFYKPKTHGKITKKVATIKNCILENFDDKKTIEIVLSDNSHQPHVYILK